MNCPVCGHVDGACAGSVPTNTHQIITADGVKQRVGPERVPRQRGRIGKAGYVGEKTGKVQVYDPAFPNITLVAGIVVDDAEPEADAVVPAAASDPPSGSALVKPVQAKTPRTPRPRKKAE